MSNVTEMAKLNRKTVIVKNCNLPAKELEVWVASWKDTKPSQIAGSFSKISELTEEQIRHFKGAPYMWKPMQGNIFGGVLLDDKLAYIHLVLATEDVLDYILELKYE